MQNEKGDASSFIQLGTGHTEAQQSTGGKITLIQFCCLSVSAVVLDPSLVPTLVWQVPKSPRGINSGLFSTWPISIQLLLSRRQLPSTLSFSRNPFVSFTPAVNMAVVSASLAAANTDPKKSYTCQMSHLLPWQGKAQLDLVQAWERCDNLCKRLRYSMERGDTNARHELNS